MRLVRPVDCNIYMDHHGSMTGQTRRWFDIGSESRSQESRIRPKCEEKLVEQPMCIYTYISCVAWL